MRTLWGGARIGVVEGWVCRESALLSCSCRIGGWLTDCGCTGVWLWPPTGTVERSVPVGLKRFSIDPCRMSTF